MCNYHIQTVKRHILGQTATCAVHLFGACVCLCATECKNGTSSSVEMPHLWICSRILCCVLVCMCVCMFVRG